MRFFIAAILLWIVTGDVLVFIAAACVLTRIEDNHKEIKSKLK